MFGIPWQTWGSQKVRQSRRGSLISAARQRRPRCPQLESLEGRTLPSFLAPVEYRIGSPPPGAVAVADFNGDKVLDLVTGNVGVTTDARSVSVLLGRGDGSFHAPVSYDVARGLNSVAVGDLDNDGHLDLVVAGFSGIGTVSVLLGSGDGTFQAPVHYANRYPWSVTLGDFNGDDALDLVTANPRDHSVSVFLGRGDGSFQDAVQYAAGSEPWSVTVSDLDGDSQLDLAVAGYLIYCDEIDCYSVENSVRILLGSGDGSFQEPVSSDVDREPFSIKVGDFNGDAIPDVVTANLLGTVSVLLGRGDGSFQDAVHYAAGRELRSVAVGDFNGDGALDLVAADRPTPNSTVSVLLGRGDGSFHDAESYPTGLAPRSVAVGDFDGDGYDDLATANLLGTVSVLMNDAAWSGPGVPAPPLSPEPVPGPPDRHANCTHTRADGHILFAPSGRVERALEFPTPGRKRQGTGSEGPDQERSDSSPSPRRIALAPGTEFLTWF